MPGRRIVVGVDGSAGSKAAYAFALAEARLRGAGVDAVMAWHFPAMAAEGGVPADFDPEGWARTALDSALDEIPAGDVPVTRRVVEGHPAGVLIHESADVDADLLVVGTRGHGGFAGVLLGSVSQHCVAHASCPVVVVPHPRH